MLRALVLWSHCWARRVVGDLAHPIHAPNSPVSVGPAALLALRL